MIHVVGNLFILETQETTYCFHRLPSGQLEHLYYGGCLNLADTTNEASVIEALAQKTPFIPGNTIAYHKDHPGVGLENLRLEYSSLGKGDVREPMVVIELPNGSRTNDFVYQSHQQIAGKPDYADLPSSTGSDEQVNTLIVTLKDLNSELTMDLLYHVYSKVNIITRSTVVHNPGTQMVWIERLMSHQLDFDHSQYQLSTFTGAWAREMKRQDMALLGGTLINGSLSGVSSNRANPFVMVSQSKTTESSGACYGINLVYSGNHYTAAQVSAFGKLRVVGGIHPTGFRYPLGPGEHFQAPEAVLTYSDGGYGAMSKNMHDFVRGHIVRGPWQYKSRPILLNSWEAAYFKFDQAKLLKLAKAGKQVGIELFVLDDGWFGQRDDDTKSLGDWQVNTKKLPQGLGGLAEKINGMGMDFGIWVEPEMVNPDSDCYRKNPHWAVQVPGQNHSLGRNQMLLDLTNPEVQAYIIEQMTAVFSSGSISYVKWDMNRIFTDSFSGTLPANEQGSFNHRYVLGLYEILKALTKAFPNILFEGCASGGNRFDLGMLCYMPQMWASDNTDAISRLTIQEGYSYGYPLSVLGAHVSDCPNHQTLRQVPLETRYNVASFGLLGYECNLVDFSAATLKDLTNQIAHYKQWRKVFQYGDFYRIDNPTLPKGKSWMVVSPDQKKAVCGLFQTLVEPNTMDLKLFAKGLLPHEVYRVHNHPFKHGIKQFGDLINVASPVHIKNGSLLQHVVSKVYQLEGEQEQHLVSGALAMAAGIALKQGFAGMGFDQQVRLFQDFASRLYYFEAK